MNEAEYQTEPLKCWKKAGELRDRYFIDYLEAKDRGGLRCSGGAMAVAAITDGLGHDVHHLGLEPHAAMMVARGEVGVECLEAVERAGFARDMCAYSRNYLGSILVDRYAFGGPFPRPDFRWQTHVCCSHAKCDRLASFLEGDDTPCYAVDIAVGNYSRKKDHKMRYIVDQMHDGIAWLEKVTGRTYDDERLIEAVKNECLTSSLWGQICTMNKHIPAPLDEKSMYTLQSLHVLMRQRRGVVDFYRELKDEVEDRIARGIAAVPVEKRRLVSTNQPPWALLKLFRYIEQYGAVSVGSLYTFGLSTPWDITDDGSMIPIKTPDERGVPIRNREEALQTQCELHMKIPTNFEFHDFDLKNRLVVKMVKDWHVDGVMMHLNRGCMALSLGVMETRRVLIEEGIPVMPYEGSVVDERDLDEAGILNRLKIFLESLGLSKLH